MTEEQFWSRVEKTDCCWEWRGARYKSGYGKVGNLRAHRISFEMSHGWVPAIVAHACDNRACVNPDHLFATTAKGNFKDAIDKTRWDCRGEKSKTALLTEEQVRMLRKDERPAWQVAQELGVSAPTVYAARQRRTWAHVD